MPNPMNGRRHGLAQAGARLAAEANAGQAPAFRFDVRRSLRMHPLPAAIVAGAVFLLLVGYALSRKPVYQAESLIYVEPLEVRVLSDGSSSGYDPSRYDSYLQQQVQTVERADTLEAALAKLPAGMWSGPGENPASAVARLESALKVERVLNSYQLAIDVTASNAEAAAAAANAITSAYLEEGRKDEHARADQRQQLLTEERQRITDDMTRDKAEQASLGTSLGVANPTGVSGNPYDMQTEGLRSQLASAREAHDTVAAQLSSVSGANGTGLDTAANELIVSDPGLVSIRQTLSQRRAVLSDQMAGLTPANPVYKQDQEEIAALDRSMDRATADARQRAERQLQDKLRLDLRRTSDVEGRLNAQLAEQTAKATGAGPKLQRAAELETDLQRLSTRYATVDDAIRGLQLETSGPGQAHLVLAARAPDSPKASRTKLILLLALPLALICGIAAAVIARKRDQRLYLAGDLQDVLGFAPMCVLPSAGEVSGAAYDDCLLRLAGGLEGAYRHGGARSFVFTPVSVNASADALLPKLCAKLQQIGFRAGCLPAEELMPAGSQLVERSGDLEDSPIREGVAATQMERFLQQHDMVLIQAPPLLGSALTEYAVRCADATILVVESTRTDRVELRRAAMLLERLNPQGIGAVLEDMPLRYADSGFRDAVRAPDRSPRRLLESRKSMRPARAALRPPEVKEAEVFDMASRHGSKLIAEEIPGPAAISPDQHGEHASNAELRSAHEPLAHSMSGREVEAAEPTIPVSLSEETVHVQPAPVEASRDWISFNEVVDSGEANGVEDVDAKPASIWTTAEPVLSPMPAEVNSDVRTMEAAPLVFAETTEPKSAPAWAAWKHADPAAEVQEPLIAELPAASQSETNEANNRATGFATQQNAPKSSPFRFEEPAEPAVAVAPIPSRADTSPSKQRVLAPFSAEPIAAVDSQPTSWWRRLLHRSDQPVPRIVPENAKPTVSEAAAGVTAALSAAPESSIVASPLEESALAAVVPTEAPHVGIPAEQQAAAIGFGDSASSIVAAERLTGDTDEIGPTTETIGEPLARLEPVAPELRLPTAAPATHVQAYDEPSAPSEPARHSYTEQFEAAGRFPQAARHTGQQSQTGHEAEPVSPTEAKGERPTPSPVHAQAKSTPTLRLAALAPTVKAELPSDSAGHVAADPKGPLGIFPRPRTSPITIAATPSMVTSAANEHRTQEVAAAVMRDNELAKKHARSAEPKMPPARTVSAPSALRPGLARAVAQAAAEDGPPARASEGLTAMRTGAGLRKALVRGEAALRSQTLTSESASPQGQQGQPAMSRRWAMLSRFERGHADVGSAEEARKSRV